MTTADAPAAPVAIAPQEDKADARIWDRPDEWAEVQALVAAFTGDRPPPPLSEEKEEPMRPRRRRPRDGPARPLDPAAFADAFLQAMACRGVAKGTAQEAGRRSASVPMSGKVMTTGFGGRCDGADQV